MKPSIKICGVCNMTDANLAIEHGAQYLGLIFVQSSPRNIEPALARSIVESLDQKAKIVGVFQNASDAEIKRITDSVGLDYVQLHGDEPPDFCAIMSKPVIKAFQIANRLDVQHCLERLDHYRPYCNHFLFDKAKTETNNNWLDFAISELKPIENQLGDYFLAGGLNASNIKTVLQNLKPTVIDIASGVEQTAREKNRKLMTEFFTALEIQY